MSPRKAVRALRPQVVAVLRDKRRRAVYVAGLSIPTTLGLAAWKASLVVISPSWFMVANLVFTVGVAAAKHVAVRSHGVSGSREDPERTTRDQRRSYRAIGGLLLLLSVGYIAACIPFLVGERSHDFYPPEIAIVIATITFLELAVSIHGVISARRSRDLLVEAIKLTGLAASMVLLVLTQVALLSFAYVGDVSVWNGVCGVLFGSLAALIGLVMVVRPLDSARTAQTAVGSD